MTKTLHFQGIDTLPTEAGEKGKKDYKGIAGGIATCYCRSRQKAHKPITGIIDKLEDNLKQKFYTKVG